MKALFKLFTFLWLLLGMHFLNAQTVNPQYKKRLESMYRKTVPLIPVAEAAKWQATAPELVFLDTREKEDYAVSHIKNALWVGYKDFDLKRLGNISRQSPIVVYCSVGYRSEKVGEKLITAGYTNIHNLYGSLFEWVNQGHPVYNNHGDRTTADTYSRHWGKWLQQGKRFIRRASKWKNIWIYS